MNLEYRVVLKSDGWAVQKGHLIYLTIKRGFPTKGDADTWVNLNVRLNKK